MTLHALDLCAMPAPAAAWFETRDYRWELKSARTDLLRQQRKLHEARRFGVTYAIEFWEQRVVEAIDSVFEAQENWKAVQRHWS